MDYLVINSNSFFKLSNFILILKYKINANTKDKNHFHEYFNDLNTLFFISHLLQGIVDDFDDPFKVFHFCIVEAFIVI